MKRIARFLKALMVTVAWVMVAKVACCINSETRKAWRAGEDFPRVDDAIANLDNAWLDLVGKD